MSFLATTQQNTIPSITGILRGGPLVAGVEVSVVLSESHTLTAQPTKQAIESGAQVSDHITLDPYSVAIVYEISNAGEGPMIARDVFETFKTMLEKRELIELLTEHFVYDNMAIISLTPMHAAPFKGRLQCTVTLQRINQIKLETVGRSAAKTTKTGSAETNGGTQTTSEPKPSWVEQTRRKLAKAQGTI